MGRQERELSPAEAATALTHLRNECGYLAITLEDGPTPHDLDWAFAHHIDGCAACGQLILTYYRSRN